MKKEFVNNTHTEGILYEHKLEMNTTGVNSKNPGTEYIRGSISIATDNAGINIVQIHYPYVTAKTAKGKDDSRFNILRDIMNGVIGTKMRDGIEKAAKVRVDSTIALNDFYVPEPDSSGEPETLVSQRRNEGGFLHIVNDIAPDEKQRCTFECDMIITSARRLEADEDRGTPEKVIVKGAIFNWQKALLPMQFSAINPRAMDYFENLGATAQEPVFTKIWGREVSETVVKQIVEESAFGEPSIHEIRSSRKDYVITGASKDPYDWDDPTTITATELKEAMAERETRLATLKADFRERQKHKGGAAASVEKFNF
jgi:hypothetical protein